MDERAALLRAIVEEPDDDVHRLVFADWLQDDGRGLPPRFALKSIPSGSGPGGFGLPSLLRRMQQLGGSLDVRRGPKGGTILRAALRDSADRAGDPSRRPDR